MSSETIYENVVKHEVTSEMLEGGLAFFINYGLLHKHGYRLTFDRTANGGVKLYVVASNVQTQFQYSKEAEDKGERAWNELQTTLRVI
jgi:hypothetical protein